MVDWKQQSAWFEAEGTKRRAPRPGEFFRPLETVLQDEKRADVVAHLCAELQGAGFTPRITRRGRQLRCTLAPIEQQKRFIEHTCPHYLAAETRRWAEAYLAEIARREVRPTAPRRAFRYPGP